MKKSINIVGAFDRYNYGDVLFPIIIEKYLNEFNKELVEKYELKYFGLVESDLTSIGGKRTQKLSDLYHQNILDGSIIVIAGGDVIPADICNMDIDLSKNYVNMIIKKATRKFFGKKLFGYLCKRKFKINTMFPWIINRYELVNPNINIVYNSVGSSTLNNIKDYEIKFIKNILRDSNYISVRDYKSLENTKDLNSISAPDSAIIMSMFFEKNILQNYISDEMLNFVNKNPQYICIQTNFASIKDKDREEEIITQINKIVNDNIKVLLLPIGIAANHDDNIALAKIKKHIDKNVFYINRVNIYDIMYSIANSQFFAGTSLHGNITAMSYGVPHIGLNKDITKLDCYLKTWDIKEQDHCIEFEKLYNTYNASKNISKYRLLDKRKELIELTLKNFEKLFSCLQR